MREQYFPPIIRALKPFAGPFDAFRLSAENGEVLFASYSAGTAIEPHTHATRNVGVVTNGELRLIKGGKEYRYGAGDLILAGCKRGTRSAFRCGDLGNRGLVR